MTNNVISQLKAEIKETSRIIRINKRAFRYNQRLNSKGIESGFKLIQAYPFNLKKLKENPKFKSFYKEIDGVYYHVDSDVWNVHSDIATAQCHLTCLHIAYNMLRHNKRHCHTDKRNEYYVEWFKSLFEGIQSQFKEEQDANLRTSTLS